MATKRKKLAIIDGKSVFYRGYYAMPNLSLKDGTPTGGVFGFSSMALEVLKRLKPDYVCVAWDKPKTNIRKRLELYPEYKAGRKPPPPDFYEQIPILHEVLEAFGWPLYELDDYEADDIMGTLAVQAAKQDIETMLVTSDMDMLQLIDPHIKVFALKKGLSNIELYSPESFEAKYGIKATQFLDLKALKGDSSDNIPGVPGIGEKGALELLKAHDTLDGVYDNLALVKDSLRKKLEAGKDLAYLSKKIAAIWTDAPIKLDLKNLDVSNCDPEKIRDILQRLEFRSLVRQLPEVMQMSADDQAAVHMPSSIKVGKSNHIASIEQLQAVDFGTPKHVFVHGMAAGKHGRKPLLLAISLDGKDTYTIDLASIDSAAAKQNLSFLSKTKLIGYDVKNVLKILIELDIDLPDVEHDVMVGAFLIDSLRRVQSITELAQTDLGYEGSGFENLSGEELVGLEPEIIAVIKSLYDQQQKQLKDMPKVSQLAHDVEWPVIPVIARMEYRGIALDTAYLKKFSHQINDTISDVEQQIYGHADQEFNISSPSQLAEVLFEKMKLPTDGIKRGKTGYSTAATELDKLRGKHEIIDLITQYREVTKLKNTYVDTLPTMVDEDSRLHTTFNLTIAQTGRLSSTDPNLQNIPIRTELGRHIRTAFVAGKGRALVSADYSQFELRLAAYLCGDEKLIDQFNRDVDVHIMTAAEVYGYDPEEVSKNMRRDAKVVNFGVMYGLSAHGLVAATGMTYGQAKEFIEKYFEVRPKLKGYIDSVKKQAAEEGYVETIFGRRRPTPDVKSSNFMVREGAYRAAVNMPFQGSAADIMKLAMVKLQAALEAWTKERGYEGDEAPNMLLQIHDSVLVECAENDTEKIAKLLKETMEGVVKLPVKLTVDTVSGKNWGEL